MGMRMDEKTVEAVARALTERIIRINRRWDRKPEDIEASMTAAVDYAWRDHVEVAQLAITAYLSTAAQAGTTEGWRTMESAPKDGTFIVVTNAEDPTTLHACFYWLVAQWWNDDWSCHGGWLYDEGAPKWWRPADFATLPVVAGGEVGGEADTE